MPEAARDIVVAWVRSAIMRGDVRLGERLPPERELAETLGVSRTAVREAVQLFAALGVVRSGVGSGPHAGTVVVAEPNVALGVALELHVATGHIAAVHIVQMRVLLEEWAARSASLDLLDVAGASSLLAAMSETDLPVQEFLKLDASFHVTLASASSNPLVTALMDGLRESISESTLRQSAELPDWHGTSARLHSEHSAIFDAYRAGDRDTAARLLHSHITGYYRETIATMSGAPAPE
jgi:GntR family transcriptional regulator, transcriptional repressor for pyruvate dehydrogenase complex